MQLVLLASFAVTMVSVFLPLFVAMDKLVDVVMAVMKENQTITNYRPARKAESTT